MHFWGGRSKRIELRGERKRERERERERKDGFQFASRPRTRSAAAAAAQVSACSTRLGAEARTRTSSDLLHTRSIVSARQLFVFENVKKERAEIRKDCGCTSFT